MMMVEAISGACNDVDQLSKSRSIQIQKKWLKLFANRVFDSSGKWRIGKHLWEGFSLGLQPGFKGSKALELYKKQTANMLYVFDETGKYCFLCKSEILPEFYNTGYDLYLMPDNESWTVIFCHDNVVYFSFAEGKV